MTWRTCFILAACYYALSDGAQSEPLPVRPMSDTAAELSFLGLLMSPFWRLRRLIETLQELVQEAHRLQKDRKTVDFREIVLPKQTQGVLGQSSVDDVRPEVKQTSNVSEIQSQGQTDHLQTTTPDFWTRYNIARPRTRNPTSTSGPSTPAPTTPLPPTRTVFHKLNPTTASTATTATTTKSFWKRYNIARPTAKAQVPSSNPGAGTSDLTPGSAESPHQGSPEWTYLTSPDFVEPKADWVFHKSPQKSKPALDRMMDI